MSSPTRPTRPVGAPGAGRSHPSLRQIAVTTAALFGVIFSVFADHFTFPGADELDRRRSAFTPFYFSIVTFTTLGFGDVTPRTLLGELLVTAEVILGYFNLGLILAVLANRVTRRA